MKNRLIVFCSLIAAVVLLSSSAFAGTARMKGLGLMSGNGSADNAEWMIQKDTNMWNYNPAWVAEFDERMSVSYDVTKEDSASAYFVVSPMQALNIKLTASKTNFNATWGNPGAAVLSPMAANMGTITGAYKLEGVGSFGLDLGYGAASNKVGDNGATSNAAQSELFAKLGGLIKIDDTMNFDIAVGYTMPSFRYYVANTADKKSDSSSLLNAFARFNYNLSENNKIHVILKYDMSSLLTKDNLNPTAVSTGTKSNKIGFGLSDEMNLTKTALAYVGIDGYYKTEKNNLTTLSTTSFNTSMRYGIETLLGAGFTGRMGLQHYVINYKHDKAAATVANGDTAAVGYSYGTEANIGVSYKINTLNMDFVVAKELFTKGPNFISNATVNTATTGGSNALALSVAITYSFESAAAEEKK